MKSECCKLLSYDYCTLKHVTDLVVFIVGLFHQIIAQSGSDLAIWAVLTPGHKPREYTQQVAAQLDCPTNDSQTMIDCMRGLDANTVRSTGFDCRVRILVGLNDIMK